MSGRVSRQAYTILFFLIAKKMQPFKCLFVHQNTKKMLLTNKKYKCPYYVSHTDTLHIIILSLTTKKLISKDF